MGEHQKLLKENRKDMTITHMIVSRRFLPSIPSLLALEAVDRLGSAQAAAQDLSLTQSAISRQLKQLEAQMGVDLILRDQLRLGLTPAGQAFAREARQVLEKLGHASIKLRANPTGGSLDLSILPAFGLNWLAPRLKDFVARHPDITVNLHTHNRPFDFAASPAQAAIHYREGAQAAQEGSDWHSDWPRVETLGLMPKHVLPVCAPDVLPSVVNSPEQLLKLPLLHLETHPDSWEVWFAQHDVAATGLEGMLFDQSSTMTQAAVHGLGVALLPTFLAREEIRLGRLVPAINGAPVSLGHYALVWPEAQASHLPLMRFRDWLLGQVRADEPGDFGGAEGLGGAHS